MKDKDFEKLGEDAEDARSFAEQFGEAAKRLIEYFQNLLRNREALDKAEEPDDPQNN